MIRKAYCYLFYKLYKFSEAAQSRWLSDWKAELVIDVLWVFIALSGLVYYTVFTKQVINLGNGRFAAILGIILICIPNYFIFHHRDQWKKIIPAFDKLPKRTNRMGSWMVFAVILIIVINLIFSFYLMSRLRVMYPIISFQ